MRVNFLCGVLLFSMLIQACAVGLNEYGKTVRFVDDKERYECILLTVVTGSNSLGYSTAHDAEGAINEVRNKAAQVGGNAVKLIDIDSVSMSTTAVGEALKCEFKE